MPRLIETPPIWAGKYVGLTFAENGRDRDGIDCWGLTRLVYLDQFGIYLPSHHDGYHGFDDAPGVANIVDRELRQAGHWKPRVGGARLGDVLLFRTGAGQLWHCGIAIARNRMLHARNGTNSCIERFDDLVWKPRLDGVYEFCGPIRFAGRVSPFKPETINMAVPAGGTLDQILEAAGVHPSPLLRVWVGDHEIHREHWKHVRPKAGRMITASVIPAVDGKSPLRIVLSIAVLAAAVSTGAGLFGAAGYFGTSVVGQALVTAGVTLVGTLAVNALIPLPRPRLSDNSGGTNSPTITGSRNEARPHGVVPQILGEHRVAPLFGALPYTEIVGDDQYLRQVFVLGRGPLELSDFKIGNTPIEDYEGVEIEVREGRLTDEPLSLYPGIVFENADQVLLEQIASWMSRTTDNAGDEISIDLTFPNGLVEFSANGDRLVRAVSVAIEYSPAGTDTWTPVNFGSPESARAMDFMFRTPEVELGGSGTHTGRVEWGLGFSGAKPAYLPTTNFSWEASGYVHADVASRTLQPYEFAIDCSDAGQILVDGAVVASWYGSHGTEGGGSPSFSHSGTILLRRGWHRIQVRLECRSTDGAVALGWKRVGDPGFTVIPSDHLANRADGATSSRGKLDYRWFDTSGYTSNLVVESDRADTIRRSLTWAVVRGQYDVRVRRVTADATTDRIFDKVYWTALRTIRNEDPIRVAGCAKIAIRIKATDQLSGAVDQFNCMARSILPDYDSSTGEWIERTTSNPASCYRAVLQGSSNARPISDSRVDIPEFEEWHQSNIDNGFRFNAVLDFEGTVFERLTDIAAAGRASPTMRDGLHSVVRDKPQSTPVQHFTPRNSHSFKGRKAFPDLPHGLRCSFLNKDAGYQRDERVVLDDGYVYPDRDGVLRDAFGVERSDLPTASRFEVVEFFGVTDSQEVWKHGRYTIAVARLRPELYELSTDVEHLACNRGDLVLVTHDVPLWGLYFGRVTRLVLDTDNNLVGLDLDDQVTMDAGEDYVVRVRLEDGTSWLRSVQTVEGQATTVTLQGPVSPSDPRPKVGDLWMFGRLGSETRELIVKSIEIDSELGATLVLIDHAPAVQDADKGEIPDFDPGISLPPAWENRPEAPVIESIRSDDYVMIRDADGSLRPRMLITLRRPSSGTRPLANAAQVRLRSIPEPGAPGEGQYTHLPLIPIDDNQVSVERVEEGITYQIRLRTVTPTGLTSVWVDAEHTVIGKVGPPPDVQSFDVIRLADGTRRYSWNLGVIPPDVAGVAIRFGIGAEGRGWDQLQPLHAGVLEGASPTELNAPLAGTWTFGIKMVDTSGNESVNALLIDRTLGPPRQDDIAFSEDCRVLGWPGTKTGCAVDSDGTLAAVGRETWDTLASPYGVSTWDQWSAWTMDPEPVIVYEHLTIDAGFLFDFEPGVYALVDGVMAVEFDYSTDGFDWAGWLPLSLFEGRTVRARFCRFRVTVSIGNGSTFPRIRELVLLLRAETITQDIEDLETEAMSPELRHGPGDIHLPISSALFAVVRTISVSFNDSGAGWTWEVLSKFTVPGPRIRLFGPDGQPADAVIDAVIRGLRSADGSRAFIRAGRLDFQFAANSPLIGAV